MYSVRYVVDSAVYIRLCSVHVTQIGVPSESMVSLSYRSLVNFVVEDNLIGFRGFLDNRNVVIDDRDEVIAFRSYFNETIFLSF